MCLNVCSRKGSLTVDFVVVTADDQAKVAFQQEVAMMAFFTGKPFFAQVHLSKC